ncbi:MAG: hypothetical protein ACTS44_01180 [Candidatus Hodgkinia cicadicola]
MLRQVSKPKALINRLRSLERKSLGCQVCKISQERFNLTET